MKDFLAYGIIGIALYYGIRVFGAKEIGSKSNVRVTNPRISKTDNNGITIRFDISVDNPGNVSVRISKPVITLSSEGRYLVSSVPENKFFNIGPLSQTFLEYSEITIPWLTLSKYLSGIISRIPSIIQEYQNTGKLDFASIAMPLEYKYSTYVNDLYFESPLYKIA